MNKVKLTLEDGTEFVEGEKIQYQINDSEWVERIVSKSPWSFKHTSFTAIAQNPYLFRKLPPVHEVPLTNADVLEMLRKGGYEWKLKTGVWVGCPSYTVLGDLVQIEGRLIGLYLAYRHVYDLIEHPMTKKEGIV